MFNCLNIAGTGLGWPRPSKCPWASTVYQSNNAPLFQGSTSTHTHNQLILRWKSFQETSRIQSVQFQQKGMQRWNSPLVFGHLHLSDMLFRSGWDILAKPQMFKITHLTGKNRQPRFHPKVSCLAGSNFSQVAIVMTRLTYPRHFHAGFAAIAIEKRFK